MTDDLMPMAELMRGLEEDAAARPPLKTRPLPRRTPDDRPMGNLLALSYRELEDLYRDPETPTEVFAQIEELINGIVEQRDWEFTRRWSR